MDLVFSPIGIIRTSASHIPRHWSLSDVEGTIEIHQKYRKGIKDIRCGQKITVLFYFHKSPKFSEHFLVQTPPHRSKSMGVFSICSPRRPNPIGLSVMEVIGVSDNRIDVRRIDMLDGTPVLDIKPHISEKQDCPSYQK